MRIVFMGSPQFAVPTLKALASNYDVVAVVTQPDRAKGRSRKPAAPAVKIAAQILAIEVLQPDRIRSSEPLRSLHELDPELIVVAAYGQILPQELLDIPVLGAVNVHASLLPRWRGASPVQAAILNRDRETGVTIMKMDAGLDTGPILSQRKTPIGSDETGGSLSRRLSELGIELLIETLRGYANGDLKPTAQDEELATFAPLLSKSDGRIDLRRSTEDLVAQIRAYEPWPGSFIEWNGDRLRVTAAHAARSDRAVVGKVESLDGKPAAGTHDGLLVLDQVQPPSRNRMSGEAFLLGYADFLSAELSS